MRTSGQVDCWGDDRFGQLGDGTPGGHRSTPGPVARAAAPDVALIVAASYNATYVAEIPLPGD